MTVVSVQDGILILKFKPEVKIVNTTDERLMMVASIIYVDKIVTYRDVDIDIKNNDYDALNVGSNQKHEGYQWAMKWCKDNRNEVVIIPRTEVISLSLLRFFLNI